METIVGFKIEVFHPTTTTHKNTSKNKKKEMMQHVLTLILLIITISINHTIATTPTTKYKIYRTLVFPCGSGIGLEIADALKNLKEIELVI